MAKTFKDAVRAKAAENPALQFISQPITYQREETPSASAPIQKKAQEREGKTRRVQLLLTPSLYEAIRNRAAEERRSVNDLISIILEDNLRQ